VGGVGGGGGGGGGGVGGGGGGGACASEEKGVVSQGSENVVVDVAVSLHKPHGRVSTLSNFGVLMARVMDDPRKKGDGRGAEACL